ncbi:MAG: 2-oxo-4-hydroxy-4-carboxy-5-ureidoimidazoline decarboxylase [Gemmatimonadales bacterium]|nr:2-oxo-4-hydroxy-4-carboxy-5-ureidoimidazoline decarboxylase [Gemmatimonadales bacterium]
MTLEGLNALPRPEAAERLRSCCGSSRWVDRMLVRRPFGSPEAMLAAADDAWREMGRADWDEAFAHHPRIGERHAAAPTSAAAQAWSAGEQGAAARSGAATRAALAEANAAYERRFGRIYLVCAAGRSGEELLADIERRMNSDPERERAVAAGEQRKITRLRLRTLIGGP